MVLSVANEYIWNSHFIEFTKKSLFFSTQLMHMDAFKSQKHLLLGSLPVEVYTNDGF
jgi:hypothetical protein